MRLNLLSASAKIHTGPAEDKEKSDLEDREMRNRVWVGTVPVYETLGKPIAAEYNFVKSPPAATFAYIEKRNAKEKGWAEMVATEKLELPLDHLNGC
jgi:hypothetical protein